MSSEKSETVSIILDLYTSPPGVHAQMVMRNLGIAYTECHPSPITDSWKFKGVNKATLPTPLPPYLSIWN